MLACLFEAAGRRFAGSEEGEEEALQHRRRDVAEKPPAALDRDGSRSRSAVGGHPEEVQRNVNRKAGLLVQGAEAERGRLDLAVAELEDSFDCCCALPGSAERKVVAGALEDPDRAFDQRRSVDPYGAPRAEARVELLDPGEMLDALVA